MARSSRPSLGASFALGASGRLLPLSIPLRFFGAATVFQLLAWVALGLGAAQVPRFAGGIGWPLAALHAATLGALAMSAVGAGLQLMPVATRQSIGSRAWPLLVWWLLAPGVAALVVAMGVQRPLWMAIAALPVIAALLLYGALMARNLAAARGMPGVCAMGWLALLSLAIALASAAAMVAAWAGWWQLAVPRSGLAVLHIAFAVFGFMGLLALGLSNVLVPMFALGPVPADRTQGGIAALAATALALTLPVAIGAWPRPWLLPALVLALAAAGWHVATMRRVLQAGLRRELGGSFVLVRSGWAGLFVSLLLAVGWTLDRSRAGLATAVVACAVAGWLLSFLCGILQRIVPFLVAMHLGGRRRRAPTPSSLTDERMLTLHRRCHVAALVLLATGIAIDSATVTLAAAVTGAIGALGFCGFFAVVLARTRTVGDGGA